MNNWSQDIYTKAYRFAAEAHWNSRLKQTVPGTDIPYLMHFSAVAMEVIAALETESDLDGNLAVQCALLHDVIEDTDTTYKQVVSEFGKKVADGVFALTKDKGLPTKAERMQDSLDRILLQPKEVWMVKLADRISNLQPPPSGWYSKENKIIQYREEAIEIHKALQSGNAVLAERLQKKISAYEKYIPDKQIPIP